MKQPVHIYYWNTKNKPGFADLWVWFENDEEAFFFSHPQDDVVSYVTLVNTVTYFVKAGFEPLDRLDMGDFERKFPRQYKAIVSFKDDTTIS